MKSREDLLDPIWIGLRLGGYFEAAEGKLSDVLFAVAIGTCGIDMDNTVLIGKGKDAPDFCSFNFAFLIRNPIVQAELYGPDSNPAGKRHLLLLRQGYASALKP